MPSGSQNRSTGERKASAAQATKDPESTRAAGRNCPSAVSPVVAPTAIIIISIGGEGRDDLRTITLHS